MTDDLDATLRRLSFAGPVAYLRAEIVGGHGTQEGRVLRDGDVTFGPIQGWIGKGRTPISQTLAALGVRSGGRGRSRDEFVTIHLDRHRHTADWLDDVPR